jgi:hypothetical protein
MKRKPILFDKITGKPGYHGRDVIGLTGTHHGAGVTFTGLMLAFYMGEVIGRKTAYLEYNNHHDMILISSAYEWYRKEANAFSFHQITCYQDVTTTQIAEIFSNNYECIIMDFGIDLTMNKEEFLRCQTKVVIGGRSEWEQQKLTCFMNTNKRIRGSEAWLYLIPQANSNIIANLKKETQRSIWAVPYVEEPTLPSKYVRQLFKFMFGT